MPRTRVVRLSYSSDEEDGDDNQQPPENDFDVDFDHDRQSTVTHQSSTSPNPNTIHVETVEISDEEFVDVSDNFSPTSPQEPPIFVSTSTPPSSGSVSGQSSDYPVSDFLRQLGLSLRREWLDSCIRGCDSSVPGFASIDVAGKAKVCFEQFLFSDMNFSGGGVLPENVNAMHLVDLPGPFVLQVDEVVNISCPFRSRYHAATSGIKRCLKLSMTDGVQRIFGIEYRPIKLLEVLAPSGLKVAICNVNVRHGLLMLVPEALEVLGGMVEELDAARQRLVQEVNKPPRGKRTRTGVLPSLARRATLAAWPSSGVNDPRHTYSSTVPGATSFQVGSHGAALAQGESNGVNIHIHSDGPTGPTASSFRANGQGATFAVSSSSNGVGDPWNSSSPTEPMATSFQADGRGATFPAQPTNNVNIRDSNKPETSNVVLDVEDVYMDNISISNTNAVSNLYPDAVLDAEDVHMVDEPEHPLILSGDMETPFTYLARLSVKWAATEGKTDSVQGKVKCFLTGVKGFQYKQRTTYELRVYVDDGSLISEILIDHHVVRKGIGYSPQEVTAALSSSDKKIVSDMKETLKQFQIFLVNFEGIMLVEINETSPLPVALEMNQGCPASDAWLLLRRLKSSTVAQTLQHHPLEPIELSP